MIEPGFGLPALTEFQAIEHRPDGTTLLEAHPKTGRTNQIRAHLWHLGIPVCGDPAYLPGGGLGTVQTLPLGAPPLCLLAWRIAFTHSGTGERVSFEDERPKWAMGPDAWANEA